MPSPINTPTARLAAEYRRDLADFNDLGGHDREGWWETAGEHRDWAEAYDNMARSLAKWRAAVAVRRAAHRNRIERRAA